MDSRLLSTDDEHEWTWDSTIISILLFLLAGLAEIGGGYLVWAGIREKREPAWLYVGSGAVVLILYGFVPTLQPHDSFGRIFGVYSGFFIGRYFIYPILRIIICTPYHHTP